MSSSLFAAEISKYKRDLFGPGWADLDGDTYIIRELYPNLVTFIDPALQDFKKLNALVDEIIKIYQKIINDGGSLSPNQETIYSDYTFHSNWIEMAELNRTSAQLNLN